MKKVFIIILISLPFLTTAQQNCNFFEHVLIKTENTQLNTTQSDFGPSFVENELWYSAYTDDEIEDLERGKSKKIFYNTFANKVDKKGNLLRGKEIQLTELSKEYHSGPVSYCPATKELFVTLSNLEDPEIRNKVYRKADIRLKIAILTYDYGGWKIAREFPHNSPAYSVAHPSISITGDTLFFTSDMSDKGFGKSDIYMSIRTEGSWGKPINLGANINTSGNDMFPLIFRNNMLIYSSNGLGNGEDLDFYFTCFGENGFEKPRELTELNSDADDFGLTIHTNQEIGYFSSNKVGGVGQDDIYKVEIEGQYNLELIVMDQKTNTQIPGAEVSFDDDIEGTLVGDIIKRKLLKNSTCVATTNVPGYMNESKTITTIGKPFGIITDTIWIEKVEVEQKFVLANIFFDFDKWNILPESEVELDNLVQTMNNNLEWKVELSSHTDSRGSNPYNDVLSQKRSDSVVEYIISKGISKERIMAKGYGEKELVNQCADGVYCSEADHRINRRTEFKISRME